MGRQGQETFGSFVTRNCAGLIRSLAAATGCRAELLDAGGRIILAAGHPTTPTAGDSPRRLGEAIHGERHSFGTLELFSQDPHLQPLLVAVAKAIGTHFGRELDSDCTAQQIRQTHDESRLLCRLTQILTPNESFTANATKLLDAAAVLITDRLLFLYQPQSIAPHWSAWAGNNNPGI